METYSNNWEIDGACQCLIDHNELDSIEGPDSAFWHRAEEEFMMAIYGEVGFKPALIAECLGRTEEQVLLRMRTIRRRLQFYKKF